VENFCQQGHLSGCFRLPLGYACEDLKWGLETVSKGFQELLDNGFITHDKATNWILIRNYLKWNPLENPNQRKAAAAHIESIPSKCLILKDLYSEIEAFCPQLLKGLRNPFETVSKSTTTTTTTTTCLPEFKIEKSEVTSEAAVPASQEAQEVPETQNPKPKKAVDERHTPFRQALEKYWLHKNQEEMPWDASDAKQLSNLLSASPKLGLESFQRLLTNRSNSPAVRHGERVRVWIENIMQYSQGPLDQYNQPIAPKAVNGIPRSNPLDRMAEQLAGKYR